MTDPIVESLDYLLKLSNEISFDNPPIIEEELPLFKLKLADGALQIQMKAFCATELEARTIVEPFLKAWELDNFMDRGRKEFYFEFMRSKIVDRNPPSSDESRVLKAEVGEYNFSGHDITFHITRKNYPPRPQNLLWTPDVESLATRYEGFLNGKEPLLSMAYFCYSLLVSISGSYKNAAKTYTIYEPVLKKLSELASVRGDKSEARKLDKNSTLIPITELERTWICETIKLIIRRKAEYDFDPSTTFTLINFDSLPTV